MGVVDLPDDVLVLIFPYLDAPDFLSLTSCTRFLLQYRAYNPYWSYITRATFRLPPQPTLQAATGDGCWQTLYRTLRTQSTVFTWGNDFHGNLGHRHRRRMLSERVTHRSTGWPVRMKNLADVGVVSDVQCGGWSTVLLNAAGQLWAVGLLNGERQVAPAQVLEQLTFPPPHRATGRDRYEAATAISQFSVGRTLVVGLADDGKIWEWVRFGQPAQMIKFFHADVGDGSRGTSRVLKVLAGWHDCSAYVAGKGIIYWGARPSTDASIDTDALIVEHSSVPGTSFRRGDQQPPNTTTASFGEVLTYVFLEHYIVFATKTNRVFVWKAVADPLPGTSPKELVAFNRPGSKILDLQGSFRRFGIMTDDDQVLTADQGLLDRVWNAAELPADAAPTLIPALQQAAVISLAFGDWHFHALHANGTITSHGHEPQGCGSLGLGSRNLSPLRGLYFPQRPGGDGHLQFPSWSNGRRTVWFEEEKERWLSDTCQRGATSEAKPRADLVGGDAEVAALMGEWFEREGQNWADGPGRLPLPAGSSGTGAGPAAGSAYRALKIAAAGWSSAALVLVDGERAEAVRRRHVVAPPQPEEEVGSSAQPAESTGGILQSVASLGRSLLGWDSYGASEPAAPPAPGTGAAGPALASRQAALNSRSNSQAAQSDVDSDIYVWDNQPYPRLRFPGGRQMPGDVPFTPWRGAGELPDVEGGTESRPE